VAALASLVPGLGSHARQLRGVAPLAGALIRKLAHEIMGHVTTLAVYATVKCLFAAGVLMAGAAVANPSA
jgi:hypothetical protein